ncbi:hypothetical protein [Rhodococcus artemisiae]|uniref:Repeat protein (TIGR01451 family) n=1 Tax=Rhodococcus artemisiae TaxID=714159 RepID=A0ABU7LB19_9NOCA|nr:hypothetical protein [Rhodococcus artemisiae]MEE2058746.1 hypothetical protein [Rhodococcus artemisiae]
MFEPNGPLPPEIYWRRRVLAIVVAVVVLALVIWAVLAFTSGDDPETEPAASETTMSETATTTPDGSGVEAGAETGSDGGGSATGGSEGSDSSNASDSGSSASSTTSGSAEPGSEDGTTPAAASTPPGQCSDQSLAVRVTAGEPNYQVGTEPEFTIVITNIGTSQCERDLGAGLQQVLVYTLDGNQRVWANTDCFPDSTADVRSLQPGDQAAFSVQWSGTTSEPGCEAPREPVQPGAYTVVGQLGGLRSTPEPFNVTA